MGPAALPHHAMLAQVVTASWSTSSMQTLMDCEEQWKSLTGIQ